MDVVGVIAHGTSHGRLRLRCDRSSPKRRSCSCAARPRLMRRGAVRTSAHSRRLCCGVHGRQQRKPPELVRRSRRISPAFARSPAVDGRAAGAPSGRRETHRKGKRAEEHVLRADVGLRVDESRFFFGGVVTVASNEKNLADSAGGWLSRCQMAGRGARGYLYISAAPRSHVMANFLYLGRL